MQPDFWHDRWTRQQTGFHEPAPNPLLIQHFDALEQPPESRVFLPLCGKTLDIDWLLAQGHEVVGAELSPIAVTALFERLRLSPSKEGFGPLQRWRTEALEIWVGDYFALDARAIGRIDAVYDRAALIAMPASMRPAYATQLSRLAGTAPQLLVTLEYEQSLIDGPPFSVREEELRKLYRKRSLQRLATADISGGLKGKAPATEAVWMIR